MRSRITCVSVLAAGLAAEPNLIKDEMSRADFILYSVDADSSLIPVLADNGHGALVPCPATRCGQPFGPGSGPGAPSFTLVTDRLVMLTVTLFTNLGGYVTSLSGEITPAHLEMDPRVR